MYVYQSELKFSELGILFLGLYVPFLKESFFYCPSFSLDISFNIDPSEKVHRFVFVENCTFNVYITYV